MTAFAVAQHIAQPWFVWAYVCLLAAVTIALIFRSEWRMHRESADGAQLADMVRAPEPPERRLRRLNRTTDARLITNDVVRDDTPSRAEQEAAKGSAVRGATAALLGLLGTVFPRQHAQEGLRPAATFLRSEMRRRLPRIAASSDFVVRLALLGTFIGIIAALTIASANIGIGQGEGVAESERMQNFLQQLLATAAAKFWISAIGLGLALVLRVWQSRIDAATDRIAAEVGQAFDEELARPEVMRAWCPAQDTGPDAISRQLHAIADQIKRSAEKWILTIELGADAARPPAIRLASRE